MAGALVSATRAQSGSPTTSSSVSPAEAAAELLKRRRARTSLIAYSNAIDIPGKPIGDVDEEDAWLFQPIETSVAAHHALLLKTAEQIITTPYGRGMFFLPPGSAKSTYGSVVLPTFCMGRWPGYKIILTSYGDTLAKKHGRKARQIVRSRKFQAIFNTEISKDSSAADEWALANTSEYMSGGILSGITGNRAHGIIIDDPVKGRQDASSPQIQKRTLEAFDDDIKTRLYPGGWILIIQTRWDQNDLAGAILPEQWDGESGLIRCRDGFDWHVVSVPAKADRADDPLGRKVGEYLWPEWFGDRHWQQFETNPRTWSALYQQRPAPPDGDYFRAEMLKLYGEKEAVQLPDRASMRVYGASDYAVTADGGDYTVHIVVGVDPANRMFVLDLWRAQASSDRWVESFCDLVLKWSPKEWAEEGGQIRGGVGPFLERRMIDRQAYVYRRQFPTRGDKAVRAQSIRARMSMHGLYLPAGAPWVADFRRELLVFDAGVNDDQVDALGLIGQMLDHIKPGQEPEEQKKKPDHLVYEAQPDGRIMANMTVFEIVEAKRRKKERE